MQHFGPEHNWEWFKKRGFISWPKKVEETYWKYFRDVRVPVYWEWMIDLGEDPQYDLYCFCYCDPLHAGSVTMEQPWIDEASKMNPYTYNITMNDNMAKQKGLKDGYTIELESDRGTKVQGVLKLRKGQHPNMATIMGKRKAYYPRQGR